ncbi:MAG TPA: hypothetical protein VGG10_11945 [Rhizomicrobium sp.]
MQISASNLLVAGQQQPRPAQQASATPQTPDDGFEALLFKPAASSVSAAAPAASGPAQAYSAPKAPGSTLDIRV